MTPEILRYAEYMRTHPEAKPMTLSAFLALEATAAMEVRAAADVRSGDVLEKAEQLEVSKRLRAFGFTVRSLSQARASLDRLRDLDRTPVQRPASVMTEPHRSPLPCRAGRTLFPEPLNLCRCCDGWGFIGASTPCTACQGTGRRQGDLGPPGRRRCGDPRTAGTHHMPRENRLTFPFRSAGAQ